ncbi:hypothetical protein B0H10DRAFT_2228341 [Mycena sp. CBHHK59/15]|nr:hypothetical protein B0H10DRAFT_2228341 [Mycena sp. CBHHK59/15]
MAYAKAFAKPISPMYAEKLLGGDFTVVPAHDQAQVEAYRMMTQRRLKTYWFHKDNVPPHTFDIDSLSANTGNLQLTSSADVEVISLCSDDEDEAAPTQSSVPAGRYSKLKTVLGSPSRKPVRAWPLKWACEMDKGFRAMNQANGKVAKRFTEAFVGTNHARVESNGLTLENLNDILKIVTNKRSKSMSTTEAIEKLGQAGVKVDWVYVADREANDPKCQLENFVRKLTSLQLEIQTTDTQTLPEPNSTNRKKAAKIPAIHTIQFNYEKEWEDAKVWQLIIFDPAVDTEPMRPKVIVVDYTDVAGNVVEMHRFNRLPLHLYEAAPTHLRTGQVASDDASTLSVGTSSLIDALFKNWKPVNFDAPFEMEYVLPGYSLDPIKMIEWANGINGPDDLKKAEWFPATPVRDHLIPALGPLEALRILLKFYPLADKGEPEAPEEDGDAPPDAPPDAGTSPATETKAEKNVRIATEYLTMKYGGRPTVIAMVRAAAQEKDAEKDAERRKSKNKFPYPVAILVDWITDVDEILRKHENGRVPAVGADDGKKSKTRTKRPTFTHKSFEALFGRRWAWLASCKEAADIIRDQQARLDGLARTKFDAFLGNMTRKVGIQTFMKLAENIGDDSEEEEEEEEDTIGEKVDLTEVPERFPIPEVDTAFILDFSRDRCAKQETKGGKPKGLGAFLKAEDQDSWGKGTNGSTSRETALKILNGIPSRRSTHKRNGGYKCEFSDPQLLADYQRTDAEDTSLTREIFSRELIQNQTDSGSAAGRTASFFCVVQRYKTRGCPKSGCAGVPVLKSVESPLGIATLPPIRLVMVVYVSDVQLIVSPSRSPADAVRTPPLASHHHHQPIWLVFTPKPSIHARSQPVAVDTLNESGETDFRSCRYAHLDTNASTRSPTLLGAAILPRAKGSPGLRAFPRAPTRSRLNVPRLVPAHSCGLTRLPVLALPRCRSSASHAASSLRRRLDLRHRLVNGGFFIQFAPPAATHACPAPLERNESKSPLPSVSGPAPAPAPAFSTEALQSARRSRGVNTHPALPDRFAFPVNASAEETTCMGINTHPALLDRFAFPANASAEETTAQYLLRCLPDPRQLAARLHLRHGDYQRHCPRLASWGAECMGVNTHCGSSPRACTPRAEHAEHHLGAAPLRRVYVLTNTWGWFVDSVRVELLKDGWTEVWGSGTLCSTRRRRSVIGRLASSRTPSCKRSEKRDEAFVPQLDFEPVHFRPFSGVEHLVISIPPLEPLATADVTILVQAVVIIDIVWLLLEHSAMAPSSGGIVKLWTPQLHLYELDAAVLNEEAFANIFAIFNFQTHTRSGVQFLSDWLVYCLGGELVDWMPGDAIQRSRKLFLDVITIRVQNFGSQEGDALALAMLLKAQMQNFRSYGQIPADFCWIDDLEQRETWDGDSDAGERDSDWEECSEDEEEDDLMDEDFPDPEYVAQDSLPHPSTSSDEPPDLVSFVQNPAKPAISVLPKKPRQAPSEDNQDELPGRWAAHIKIFFFTSEEELEGRMEESELEPQSAVDVVDDLVCMRLLPESHWRCHPFQAALETSGLLNMMHYICCPGNLIETSHPDVEESFRWHDWKVSYAELYCRWVKATLTQEEYDRTVSVPDPNYKFSIAEGEELLTFMKSPPLELKSPSGKGKGKRRKQKQKSKTVQALAKTASQGAGQHAKKMVLGNDGHAPPQQKRSEAHHNSCPHCADLPMEQQCIRIIYVKPRDCSKILGAALTCAPVGDRLKPKPPAKRKKGGKGTQKHRPKVVYQRCRKDIVRFVWQHDGVDEMVGGVRFKALSKKTLAR